MEHLVPREKLWLESDGKLVMSDYRLRLLQRIAEAGSLARAANEALAAPDVKQTFQKQYIATLGGTPDAFATLIRNDLARFGKLVKAAGIKAD